MNITDAQRLDFLDGRSAALNAHHGTRYGWRLEANHNRVLLSDSHLPVLTVREAIDAAIMERVRTSGPAAHEEIFGVPVKVSPHIPPGCMVYVNHEKQEFVVRSAEGFERRVRQDDIRARAMEIEEIIEAAFAADADISPGS